MIMMIVMITMTVMMITGIPGLAVPACSRYLMTAATEMSPPFHTQCVLHTATCIVAPMHTGQNSSAFESSAHPLHTGMFCTLVLDSALACSALACSALRPVLRNVSHPDLLSTGLTHTSGTGQCSEIFSDVCQFFATFCNDYQYLLCTVC